MNEFKGTKGKWEVDGCGVYSLDPLVLDNIVCLQPDTDLDSHKNWKANAQLISKAPEMLEILFELHSLLEENLPNWYTQGHHRSIEKLIKEATKI